MPSIDQLLASLSLLICFLLGWYLGRVSKDRAWESRVAALARLAPEPVANEAWRRDIEFVARSIAYARAADAVCLWPHRIDKKADLARHLESLATAPELGAATPNPEREPQEEPRPQDTADSPSRVPSAAPVLERPEFPPNIDLTIEGLRIEKKRQEALRRPPVMPADDDETIGVESGTEGRIDPMEGFL